MEAEIRQIPTSFDSEVYLYIRDGQQTIICNLDGTEKQRVGFGEEAEPSFRIASDALSALVAAGSDLLPPSQAVDRHLSDAIKVRDRLMDAFVPTRSDR